MSGLSDRMSKLSPEKRALLQQMLLKKASDSKIGGGIEKRSEADRVPLSFSQQRLWFLEQLKPGTPMFNLSAILQIQGDLDREILQVAFNETINRHEILRTRFVMYGDMPCQIIAPQLDFDPGYRDLRSFSENDRKEKWEHHVRKTALKPFDLQNGPMLRARLLQLTDLEYTLLITMHHMITDGWSMGLFIREITSIYTALKNGVVPEVRKLPIQYADFALWQRKKMTGDYLDKLSAYWKQKLFGAPKILPLPSDRSRPKEISFEGNAVCFRIPTESTSRLKQMGRETETTLFMILIGVFAVLLSRYSRMEDIVIGTPVAGRNHKDTENLIGFFVNTLALRVDLSENPCFGKLLEKLKRTALEAFDHQDLPFEKLVEALQIDRGLDHTPVFQVMFVLQNAPLDRVDLPGLTLTYRQPESYTSQFDVTLSITEVDGGLDSRIEYSTQLFDPDRMERMAGHYQVLVDAVIKAPDRPVFYLPMLAPSEIRHMEIFNQTAASYPSDKTIVDLFEYQAAEYSSRTAIIFKRRAFSYRQVNETANRLAHHIRSTRTADGIPIGPEDRIAVFMRRSQWIPISALAIMKAGAAYVPIDTAMPPERLSHILKDSQCRMVLINARYRDFLKSLQPDLPVVDVQELSHENRNNLCLNMTTHHLAYVIYTSGSTGQPKGVMVEHGGFVNMVMSQIRLFDLDVNDRFLQFSSCSFDASVYETFNALLSGGGLVCASEWDTRDPLRLSKLICDFRVTVAVLPPSFIKAVGFENLRNLRTLITAGEPAIPDRGLFIDDTHRYWNAYGPTETSVCASCFSVPCDWGDRPDIPIGKPISNLQMWILDPDRLQIQPVGVPGEICISGVGLARGYLNKPQMTREKFIANPIQTGSRLYRTGDLGYLSTDGNFFYLGRIDDQVKIRGYRIEPDEIENCLQSHPSVRMAVVAAKKVNDHRELIAFILPEDGFDKNFDIQGCFNYMKKRLPDYMIPVKIVIVDQFPYTTSGKIDKNALYVPDVYDKGNRTVAEPLNERQKAIAGAWAKVLNSTDFGIDDTFFSLGGDSIKAIQVICHLQHSGWKLDVKDLFRYPKIIDLADRILPINGDHKMETPAGIVPLTAVQCWFFEEIKTDPHHFNQSVMLRARPRFDIPSLKTALNAVFRHHDTLRLQYTFNGNHVVQKYASEMKAHEPVVMELQDVDRAQQIMAGHVETLQASMNLEKGELLKTAVYRLKAEDLCLVTIHHLVVDGVSMRILLEDFNTAYGAVVSRKPVQLPPQTVSFKLWSQAVQDYADSEEIVKEAAFWDKMMAFPMNPLPEDLKGGNNLVGTAGRLSLTFSVKETKQLLTAASQARGTFTEILLLAGIGRAISQWADTQRVVLLMVGHGRESVVGGLDVSRTVGWFSSMFPLAFDVTDNDISGLILRVKNAVQTMPNRGIGFGILKYIRRKQAFVKYPWPEIVFNYAGQFDQEIETPWFSAGEQSVGNRFSPHQTRVHTLEITGIILNQRLNLFLIYDGSRFLHSNMQQLMNRFASSIRQILDHCLHHTP